MTATTESKTDRIRELNDAFRRTFVGGAVMITAGVEAMPLDQRRSLLQCGASTRSAKITTPTPSTTSARLMKPANGSSGRSTSTTATWSSARRTRPIPPSRPAFSPSCVPTNTEVGKRSAPEGPDPRLGQSGSRAFPTTTST